MNDDATLTDAAVLHDLPPTDPILSTRATTDTAAQNAALLPDGRAVSAVESVLKTALGREGWPRVRASLAAILDAPPPDTAALALARAGDALGAALDPGRLGIDGPPPNVYLGQAATELFNAARAAVVGRTPARIQFGGGLVKGVAEAVDTAMLEQVEVIRKLVTTLVDYHTVAFDLAQLSPQVLRVWFLNAPLTDLAASLKEYPDLLAAITQTQPIIERLTAFAHQFTDDQGHVTTASALAVITRWVEGIPEALGSSLRPHIDELVNARDDPGEQGAIIGRCLGQLILTIVMTVLGLVQAGREALRFLAEQGAAFISEATKGAQVAITFIKQQAAARFIEQDLAPAAMLVESQVPGISTAGNALTTGVLKQLISDYGEFNTLISPHRLTTEKLQAWGRTVRDYGNLTVKDVEWAVKLRLDSHHILEKGILADFKTEYQGTFANWPVKDRLGRPVVRNGQPLTVSWRTIDDMDTMPLPTETHIRSGDRMSEILGLTGAEGQDPLSKKMNDFFDQNYLVTNGARRKFRDLGEVIEAHDAYYKANFPPGHLDDWFQRARAAYQKWLASQPSRRGVQGP